MCVSRIAGQGKKVTTIKSMATNGKLHPLQKAFVEHNAVQCGYCTSGMILNAYSLLKEKPHASYTEIVEGMEEISVGAARTELSRPSKRLQTKWWEASDMTHGTKAQTDFIDAGTGIRLTRRQFLRGRRRNHRALCRLRRSCTAGRGTVGLPGDFNAYLRIGEDGKVTCFTGKIEMGQGINSSLPQMLADELDVALDSMEIILGRYRPVPL